MTFYQNFFIEDSSVNHYQVIYLIKVCQNGNDNYYDYGV